MAGAADAARSAGRSRAHHHRLLLRLRRHRPVAALRGPPRGISPRGAIASRGGTAARRSRGPRCCRTARSFSTALLRRLDRRHHSRRRSIRRRPPPANWPAISRSTAGHSPRVRRPRRRHHAGAGAVVRSGAPELPRPVARPLPRGSSMRPPSSRSAGRHSMTSPSCSSRRGRRPCRKAWRSRTPIWRPTSRRSAGRPRWRSRRERRRRQLAAAQPRHGAGRHGARRAVRRAAVGAAAAARRSSKRPVEWLRRDHSPSRHGQLRAGVRVTTSASAASRISPDLDLSRWRVAGCGAEPIHAGDARRVRRDVRAGRIPGHQLSALLRPRRARRRCDRGAARPPPAPTRSVAADELIASRIARPPDGDHERSLTLVSCGSALPGHRVRIAAEDGGGAGGAPRRRDPPGRPIGHARAITTTRADRRDDSRRLAAHGRSRVSLGRRAVCLRPREGPHHRPRPEISPAGSRAGRRRARRRSTRARGGVRGRRAAARSSAWWWSSSRAGRCRPAF